MKTILDLPDALVRAVELRAAEEQRDPADVIADLLAAGLAQKSNVAHQEPSADSDRPEPPHFSHDKAIAKSLPLIKVRPATLRDAATLTTQQWCNWLKEVDAQQEVERYEQTLGHQHVDRADG